MTINVLENDIAEAEMIPRGYGIRAEGYNPVAFAMRRHLLDTGIVALSGSRNVFTYFQSSNHDDAFIPDDVVQKIWEWVDGAPMEPFSFETEFHPN